MAMANAGNGIRYIEIDAAMRKRFDVCAPAALARRSPSRLRAQAMSMLQWLVIGGIGLFGLYVWHWPAASLLVVWLAGVAVGIFSDLVKWVFARQRLIRQLESFSDDQFVWHMVTAMQKNENRIREEATQVYRPGTGLAFDLGFGLIATFLFALWFRHQELDVIALVRSDIALQRALLVVAATPLVAMIATLATLGRARDAEIDYQAGGRGLGLFFVIIAFMFFSEMPDAMGKLMVFVNGATLVIGLLAAFGLWLMAQERDWLARHLGKR
ncbi:MAG: hypothetical protein IPP28_12615 [Xanthomonadales bacterium]|nr:hypothetical protein [Xanthomonadales bacterium]